MSDEVLLDVLTEVGMTKTGHRKRFVQALQHLRATSEQFVW